MAADDQTHEVEKRVEEEISKEEEDTGAQIAPIVKLEEIAVSTGEEDENALLDMKAKLYRFDKDGNQWKERGVGTVKLLKHKETEKVRLVMRQSKTLKICANHLVLPSTSLQEHAGNDKSCVWHATDFSDGELKEELFCIRFATVDNAKKFRDMIEEIAETQAKKSEEVDEAASALKNLKVEDQKEDVKDVKEEEKEKEEKPATKAEEKEVVEKPETKAEEKEVVEKPETKAEEKEVVEKPETKAEEKEVVEKPETKAEEKEVVEKPDIKVEEKEVIEKPESKAEENKVVEKPEAKLEEPAVTKQEA